MQMMIHRYDRIAVTLHWVTVLLVCTMFILGWYMVDLPQGSSRGFYFSLHKSLGILTFLLIIFRLIWRINSPPPDRPSEIRRFRGILADAVHRAFYFVLLIQPITGYLSSSFSGYKTSFFSLPLPYWGWSDPPLNEFFTQLHVVLSTFLVVLIIMHSLGAILHVIEGHGHVLKRMWF